MDGAGWWQQFKAVTLPFLRPAMLPFAIYGFVVTFNLFYLSYFMSGGGPFGQTELLVTTAYRLVARAAPVPGRCRVRDLRVLHPPRHHAGHEQAGESDGAVRCMTAGPFAPHRRGGCLDDHPVVTATAAPTIRPSPGADRQRRRLPTGRQLILQLVCIAIAVTVLFPIVWIVAMSLDPRNISRPDSLIPPGASLQAYAQGDREADPERHPVPRSSR